MPSRAEDRPLPDAGGHCVMCCLAAQIALCCVTITAAFVALRGLGRSLTADKGFDAENAVVTKFELSEAGYSGEGAEHMQRELLEKVARLPGVVHAAYSNSTPLADTHDFPVFKQDTTDFRTSNKAFDTFDFAVSPGYFATAATPLLAGREFSFADTATSPAVAIVNRQFARSLFQSEQVLGRYFKDASGHSMQIVGMVGDGKYFSIERRHHRRRSFFPSCSTQHRSRL